MRTFWKALAIAVAPLVVASPAVADDAILVLGTDRYPEIGPLSRGTEVVDVAPTYRFLGYEVFSLANGSPEETTEVLQGFTSEVPEAERLIVVLSGRFVTDGDRTWYLTQSSPRPIALTVTSASLSVETVMNVMSFVPGNAILILAAEPGENTVYSRWLREGIGTLDIPQGVTVLRGLPRDVARFMERDMTQPGADLRDLVEADSRISATGFLPRGLTVMSEDVASVLRGTPTDLRAEQAMWEGAVALDTEQAYVDYLNLYPNGVRALEARALLEEIRSDPDREFRLIEEALRLTRDQKRDIQRDLNTLGYNTRGVDGIFGPGTRSAITNWQQQNGFSQTGFLNSEQIIRLDAQAARRTEELAAEAERQRVLALQADRAFWEETGASGRESDLRTYLGRYPSGLFAEVARARLAAIASEAERQQTAADRAAWDRARAVDTRAAYEGYLNAYPQGAFAEAAIVRLAAIRDAATQPGIVIAPDGQIVSPDGQLVAPDGMILDEAALAAGERELGLTALTARLVEARLAELGHNPGNVDGRFDESTRNGIRSFQSARGLPVTGFMDRRMAIMLLGDVMR